MTGPQVEVRSPSPASARFRPAYLSPWRLIPAPHSAASGVRHHRKQAQEQDSKA
jgi:hypothetical protein